MGVLSVPINEEIMACSTWMDVLEHAVRRGEQMDEVNTVTSLHRAAKLHREEDAGQTPVEVVRRTEGFQCLIELVWHFAVRCRPQQLANSVWACAVLLYQDADLLERLCGYAVQRLSGYTPQNVANTIWALATLGFQHEELLNLVLTYVEAMVREFSPQDLANIVWAYAKLGRACDRLFQLILAESLVRLDSFQAQNMSNLVWACATIMYNDEAAMQSIARFAAGRVEDFSTQELSNFTWGMATLNLSSDIWLENSGAEMARRSRECCPQDLSNTIWAYGTLVHKRNDHLRAINWEVMRQIDLFSPQGLSNVTWGLSAIEYRDIKALTCISEEVIRRPLEQMTPPDISTLIYSFAVIAWAHEGALAKLRRAIRYHLPTFATRDVANVSWALVTLSHRDDNIFRRLHARAEDLMPDFSVQGLCNIAWAFVRFGLPVPVATARGIAEETVKRRDELTVEPGDAVLLSDAVCSEWFEHVPKAIFEECDAIGREQYEKVFGFLSDMSNIPSLGGNPLDVERYQNCITGFGIIQLGRRLTVEFLRRLDMLGGSEEAIAALRPKREAWLIEELTKVDPTDASLQHKTTCTWALVLNDESHLASDAQVVASGTPMEAEMRFVSCVVEHPRASDAEFQVVNKAAELLLRDASKARHTVLHIDVSEIPCLSCLGALRQFQKAFPQVKIRLSFSIRKVADFCLDMSMRADEELEVPTRRHDADSLPPAPNNRGRSSAPVASAVRRVPSQPARTHLSLGTDSSHPSHRTHDATTMHELALFDSVPQGLASAQSKLIHEEPSFSPDVTRDHVTKPLTSQPTKQSFY